MWYSKCDFATVVEEIMGKREYNLLKWSWRRCRISPNKETRGLQTLSSNTGSYSWTLFFETNLWHVVYVPQDVNNSINIFLSACLWPFLIISWNSTEDHIEYEVSTINRWFPVLRLWFNQRLLLCAAQHFSIIIIKLSRCNDILLHTEIAFKTMFAKSENWVEVFSSLNYGRITRSLI